MDDIAIVDADAEAELSVGRRVEIAFGDGGLNRDGRLDSPDDAGEFGQNAVAGQVDYLAATLVDHWQHKGLMTFEHADRRVLIGAHQGAVA